MRLLLGILAIVVVSSCSDDEEKKVLVNAEEVVLNVKNTIIEEGKTFQLIASVKPKETSNKKCNWFSDNTEIATVDENGIVNALKPGKVNITVATINDLTAICNVEVSSKPIMVSSVALSTNNLTLKVGASEALTASISPSDATNKDLLWKSSENDIVSVSKTGLVSAKAIGEALVTVTSVDGAKTAQCKVIVEDGEDENACIDKEGRVYKTVKIGEQIWMAENLAYLTAEMVSKTAYVYDYVGTDLEEAKARDNFKNYGVLYTFEEAEKCIPDGWHLPTDAEWQELEMFIGNSKEEVEKAGTRGDYSYKLMSKEFWSDTEFVITNETGFSALPSGYRSSGGSFSQITKRTVFWGARYDGEKSKGRAIFYDRSSINRSDARFASGYCVRCIKD